MRFSDRAFTFINGYLEMFYDSEYTHVPDGDFGKSWLYFNLMFIPILVEKRGKIYDDDWAIMNKLLEKYEIVIDMKGHAANVDSYKAFNEAVKKKLVDKGEKRLWVLIDYVVWLEKKYRIKELAQVARIVIKPAKTKVV